MGDWAARLSAGIETWRLHERMQDVSWAVPAVQTVHILAIAIVFSSSLVVALRATHVSGIYWSPARWGQRLNAWVFGALFVLLLTGSLLVIGEPGRSLPNWIFQLKMVLVIAAAALSALLAHRLQRLDPPEQAGLAEQALAVLLVGLWMAVISAGRWIAYVS